MSNQKLSRGQFLPETPQMAEFLSELEAHDNDFQKMAKSVKMLSKSADANDRDKANCLKAFLISASGDVDYVGYSTTNADIQLTGLVNANIVEKAIEKATAEGKKKNVANDRNVMEAKSQYAHALFEAGCQSAKSASKVVAYGSANTPLKQEVLSKKFTINDDGKKVTMYGDGDGKSGVADQTVAQIRNLCMQDAHDLAYQMLANEEGDVDTVWSCVHNKTLELDMVNDAIVALLEEQERAKKHEKLFLMWKQYLRRRLNNRVVDTEDLPPEFEDVQLCGSQVVAHDVREEISRRGQVVPKGFTRVYQERTVVDPETGEEETYYERLSKCCDIGGYVTDFNGKNTEYVVKEDDVDKYDAMMKKLDLTDNEAVVIKWYMKPGLGEKSVLRGIKKDLGYPVPKSTVYSWRRKVGEKAVAAGVVPDGYDPVKWKLEAIQKQEEADAARTEAKRLTKKAHSKEYEGKQFDEYKEILEQMSNKKLDEANTLEKEEQECLKKYESVKLLKVEKLSTDGQPDELVGYYPSISNAANELKKVDPLVKSKGPIAQALKNGKKEHISYGYRFTWIYLNK